MSLSPDERALLAIAGSLLSAEDQARPRPCSPGLAELLRRHHLRPLAHQLGVEGLEQAHRECAVIAAFHHRSLAEVGDAFGQRAIAWTAIKGAAYAWDLYEEPALRPMSDLDILVKAQDFDRAARCLEECGYRQRAVSVRTRHAQTFFRASHELIDLHRSILQPLRGNAAMSRAWDRAQPAERFPGYWQLDPVDLCCIHIAHIARHEFVVPLVGYVDLQRLLGALSAQETSRLHQALEGWRLSYALAACLEVIATLSRGQRSPHLSARMRVVLPTLRELLVGAHRDRSRQIARKLTLFPRDTVALGLGWALRTVEDRLIGEASR